MTNRSKDLKLASAIAAALFFLSIIFQLIDGGYSIQRLLFSMAPLCILTGYVLTPDELMMQGEETTESNTQRPLAQLALYAGGALFFLLGVFIGYLS